MVGYCYYFGPVQTAYSGKSILIEQKTEEKNSSPWFHDYLQEHAFSNLKDLLLGHILQKAHHLPRAVTWETSFNMWTSGGFKPNLWQQHMPVCWRMWCPAMKCYNHCRPGNLIQMFLFSTHAWLQKVFKNNSKTDINSPCPSFQEE